jgi:Xaa-Pro aminopeptidase
MSATATASDLTASLRGRVLAALGASDLDVVLVAGAENIGHLTGYRSLSETMKREPTMLAALDRGGALHLVAPAADAGPVLHDGLVPPDHLIPYGRFYFESADGHPASEVSGVHASFAEAVATLVDALDPAATIGADAPAASLLAAAAATRPIRDASVWMLDVRARKLPAEVARLERAARVTEDAIDRSLELIRPGVTEIDLAHQIAGDIASVGGSPRFIVVTSGERSALSDAAATGRRIERGDLVRFDIGCVLDGYWADLGRTVVVGDPTEEQRRRYDAVLAGEQAQLDAARPGITGAELFALAVERVEAGGIRPYRRHHCGHAIGSEVYERPIIAPGWDQPLEVGMTFCFETPFYDLGWGGLMVEDTVVITEDGCRLLNGSDRSLRIV